MQEVGVTVATRQRNKVAWHCCGPHQCSALYGTSFLSRNHTQQERYCGMAEAGERSETHDPPSGERKSERDRRSTRTRRELKRDCSLVLVADYLYFKNIGQGSKMKTLHAMVSFKFSAALRVLSHVVSTIRCKKRASFNMSTDIFKLLQHVIGTYTHTYSVNTVHTCTYLGTLAPTTKC